MKDINEIKKQIYKVTAKMLEEANTSEKLETAIMYHYYYRQGLIDSAFSSDELFSYALKTWEKLFDEALLRVIKN